MSQKPYIVLVPGSFAPAKLYTIFVEKLKAAGYTNVESLDLPSVGRREGKPAATMAEDAEHINSVAKKLIDAGNDVLLVSHSYGGVPATESLRGLNKKEKGKNGVIGLLYVTSIVPEVGQGGGSTMGEGLPDYLSGDVCNPLCC
jgi:surfactin synthase thioesterase subunit